MKKFILPIIGFTILCNAAYANVASVQYVNSNKPDWNETNMDSPRYIENKPQITTSITGQTTDDELPTARAVSTAIDAKADRTDVKFDSVPLSRPDVVVPDGRALIWIEE